MNVDLKMSVTGLAVIACFPEGVKRRQRQKNE